MAVDNKILTSIVLIMSAAVLSGCKLGEIDINTPTNLSCTSDGFKSDPDGVIIVDEQGAALDCVAS